MILHGEWRLTVREAIHNWENRFRIENAAHGNGTYPATVGSVIEAGGLPQWDLIAEYRETGTTDWHPSDMKRLSRTQDGAELDYVLGAEDPLPFEDFEDIQWDAEFIGQMFDIPYRPFAVKMDDLFQMPDGIFDTLLGAYYMGVRVTNTWGEAYGATATLDISNAGRSQLATRGILVNDAWTWEELDRLGQAQVGRGMSLAGLRPGESRTVYFKIDVAGALPRKYEVEFVHIDTAGTPDPFNPKRLQTKQIFVSSSRADSPNGELVCELQEGRIRLKLSEVAYDLEGARRARYKERCRRKRRRRDGLAEFRESLERMLAGQRIDLCDLYRLLQQACECEDDGRGDSDDPNSPCVRGYRVGPFFAVPTKYRFVIEPNPPFEGQYGPIPFDDPWWKVALLILAALLFLAGVLTEAADLAYHDEDLVIGDLDRFQADDVDAALCLLDTDRAQNLREMIDARSDEPNLVFVQALDGVIALNGPVMTRTEIDGFLAAGDTANLRVFKSGARTGLTWGIITSSTSSGHPGVTWGIGQIRIGLDADPAFGNNMGVNDEGDSGSVWVHHLTRRPVGLHHSGDADGTTFGVASFLEDVQTALNVTV